MSISLSDNLNVANYQMPDKIDESIGIIQQSLETILSDKSISVLNYIEDYESEKFQRIFGHIYFFLQNTITKEIKTIHYSNYKKHWVMGENKEIIIKPINM